MAASASALIFSEYANLSPVSLLAVLICLPISFSFSSCSLHSLFSSSFPSRSFLSRSITPSLSLISSSILIIFCSFSIAFSSSPLILWSFSPIKLFRSSIFPIYPVHVSCRFSTFNFNSCISLCCLSISFLSLPIPSPSFFLPLFPSHFTPISFPHFSQI